MAILNKDSYYKIHTSFEQIGSPYWHMPTIKNMIDGNITFHMYYFDENKDYWFIEVYNGNSFECYPIETIVPEEILRKLWNKEIFLLVSNTHETYHSVVTGIYRDLIVRAKIPVEQIILLSESADIIEEVDVVRKKYNLGQINVEWTRSFEYTVKNQLINYNVPLTLQNKHYDKKFLSFNRHMMPHGRLHRGSLIALLTSMNLLDKGFVSAGMYSEYPTWNDILIELKRCHNDNDELIQLLMASEEKILNIGELSIDIDSNVLQKRDNAYLLPSIFKYYTDSYFSVVTETNCFAKGIKPGDLTPPGRLLSEKTFKTIAVKHPFILVANAGTLPLLKKVGYKTFSPWIDESYDSELNESARMLMIVKEIKRLCELSPDQLTDFLNHVREICNYNYNILLSKTRYTTKLNY
jgi:hypothetical protein